MPLAFAYPDTEPDAEPPSFSRGSFSPLPTRSTLFRFQRFQHPRNGHSQRRRVSQKDYDFFQAT
ncbi:MAG: hypothetical protein ACI9U2_003857 [Bradymonadia bacterium]|jgi:hypothetical protein